MIKRFRGGHTWAIWGNTFRDENLWPNPIINNKVQPEFDSELDKSINNLNLYQNIKIKI